MATDRLSMSGFVIRTTIVLGEDCLIGLEHETTSDRMRRTFYDRIAQVLVWKTFPLGRFILVTLLLLVPGLLLALLAPFGGKVAGAVIVAIAGAILAYYALCRVTHIRVAYGDSGRTYKVIALPRRVRRFVSDLVDRVGRANADAAQQRRDRPASPGVVDEASSRV